MLYAMEPLNVTVFALSPPDERVTTKGFAGLGETVPKTTSSFWFGKPELLTQLLAVCQLALLTLAQLKVTARRLAEHKPNRQASSAILRRSLVTLVFTRQRGIRNIC